MDCGESQIETSHVRLGEHGFFNLVVYVPCPQTIQEQFRIDLGPGPHIIQEQFRTNSTYNCQVQIRTWLFIVVGHGP